MGEGDRWVKGRRVAGGQEEGFQKNQEEGLRGSRRTGEGLQEKQEEGLQGATV